MIIAVFDGPHGQRVRAFENPHAAEEWRQRLARQYWSYSGIKTPFREDRKAELTDAFFSSPLFWFQAHEEVRLEFSYAPDELDRKEFDRPITIAETLRRRAAE